MDSLATEKHDTEKIKILVLIENESFNLKEKQKLFHLIRTLENYLNDTDCLNSNIFKGQILITITTVLIITNCKNDHPLMFLNFVNNILIEHIKNTNNYNNVYLREICCKCLEELENEYPGLLFNLLGKKSLDMLENKDNYGGETKSIANYSMISMKNKKEIPVYDKKIDLESKLF